MTVEAPEPTPDGPLGRVLNRVVGMNADMARRHIARFGGGKTGDELLVRLDRQYRATLTGSGAAVGSWDATSSPAVARGEGLVVIGRLAPFGIGIGIGGVMGAVSSTVVIRATRRAFAADDATVNRAAEPSAERRD